MGAQQSSSQDSSSGGQAVTKTCYYELLSLDRHATDDDIKKAYRRKALELHPDRNYGDVENATRKFAEVQSAYEVLSDPQERAWYDSHRDAILSGQDQTDDGARPATFRNVRLTSTEEILGLMRKFNATVPFDDEPTGFYGIARETFEHLALEEEAAAEYENVDVPDYPTFGSSDDDYDSVVRPFYSSWAGFSTRKTFSWKDKYRLSDAPDRRVRRLMEKENKKCRDDAAREFNDAVRFLVSFVRKRDPRYLPNTQTDADRQKSMRDAAAAQAARSRAAHQEKIASYQVPEWARSREDDNSNGELFSGTDEDEESEQEVEVLECVVCNKTFKSDKQLEAHERSKKHTKAVQQLRWQMRKEGVDLDINDNDHAPVSEVQEQVNDEEPEAHAAAQPPVQSEVGNAASTNLKEAGGPAVSDDQSSTESDGDDYAPRSAVEERLTSKPDTEHASADDDLSNAAKPLTVEDDEADVAPKRVGKAKAKREKKAAQHRAQGDDQHHCSVCAAVFSSRTKLFLHIRDEGHAAAVPASTNAAKNKKKKKP